MNNQRIDLQGVVAFDGDPSVRWLRHDHKTGGGLAVAHKQFQRCAIDESAQGNLAIHRWSGNPTDTVVAIGTATIPGRLFALDTRGVGKDELLSVGFVANSQAADVEREILGGAANQRQAVCSVWRW